MIGYVSLTVFCEKFSKILSLMLLPSLDISLQVNIGTFHLVKSRFHQLGKLLNRFET